MNNNLKTCVFQQECATKSDTELVELIQKDPDCYGCLTERYKEKIIRYIQRISGVGSEAAEDIWQNVTLKVFTNLSSFRPEMKFSSWFYRIAHNETISFWRSNRKKNESSLAWNNEVIQKGALKDVVIDPENEIYRRLTQEQLTKAIQSLNERYRSVIVLSLEGQSYQEISQILKIPLGTVGTLILRAKKKLKEQLADIDLAGF